MMTADLSAETLPPVEALDVLIARHGTLRVAMAMSVAAFKRRRARVVFAHSLSPHLLRDMGIEAGFGQGRTHRLALFAAR
jgi:hypothetical protein